MDWWRRRRAMRPWAVLMRCFQRHSRSHRSRYEDPSNLTAHISDKDGPYSVDAQLTLSRARNVALEGTLAPRGPVPPAMDCSLQLLGPADAMGRRQFSVGGTL